MIDHKFIYVKCISISQLEHRCSKYLQKPAFYIGAFLLILAFLVLQLFQVTIKTYILFSQLMIMRNGLIHYFIISVKGWLKLILVEFDSFTVERE